MSRYRIRITLVDGREVWWHKGGAIHTLAAELAPVWVANFKPALFQGLPEGGIVPRGAPGAVDIGRVEAVPEE